MRAAEGAIEGVKLTDDGVEVQVIGDVEATGICGSGLVDVVSELLRVGLLEPSGRLLTRDEACLRAPAFADRLAAVPNGKGGEERVFVLTWNGDGDPARSVYLSQVDVRRLQEAKAAIATGWKMLVRRLGIAESDIQQVLLGGSFGAFLTPASAVRIGLVPRLPVTRIVAAGNVAGEGAKIAALSLPERHAAAALLDEVEYVEASGNADYNELFLEELTFPS
jgi:uncharacterized 2Fe-2S/4Fe-4S cluster protein (DUF4445 family)